jgi:hypothetical protein
MLAKDRKILSYRHHKSRDLAVVTINGKDIYLGKYKSPESSRKYDKLIQERLARKPPSGAWVPTDAILQEIIDVQVVALVSLLK